MSIKNFLGSIIKKRITIDVSPEDYYFEVIPEVKKWFMDLPIPISLAALVTELYFDGGNEIYAQLIPYWDGEDDVFDIETLTEEDISQVPNLKTLTARLFLCPRR